MYRVYTTSLESYRLFLSEDWMSEERLIEQLTSRTEPTEEMKKGTAWHKILEQPAVHLTTVDNVPCYAADGYRFRASDIEKVATSFVSGGLAELRTWKMYMSSYGAVGVVSRVDRIRGSFIEEHKTRWKPFDINKYMDSCQHRFYLDAFGATACQYNVSVMKHEEEESPYSAQLLSLEQFKVYPYEGMANDLTSLVDEFMAFVVSRNLQRYFVPRNEHTFSVF